MYTGHTQHRSCTIPIEGKKITNNLCSQEIPSNFFGKFSMTTSIHDSIFPNTYLQLEIFHDHSIHDHLTEICPSRRVGHFKASC